MEKMYYWWFEDEIHEYHLRRADEHLLLHACTPNCLFLRYSTQLSASLSFHQSKQIFSRIAGKVSAGEQVMASMNACHRPGSSHEPCCLPRASDMEGCANPPMSSSNLPLSRSVVNWVDKQRHYVVVLFTATLPPSVPDSHVSWLPDWWPKWLDLNVLVPVIATIVVIIVGIVVVCVAVTRRKNGIENLRLRGEAKAILQLYLKVFLP